MSRDGYGAINGALVVPMTIARALSPLAAAALWTTTGSYGWTMTAVLGLSIVMVLAFWMAAASARQRG